MLKITSDASIGQLKKEVQVQQESQKQLLGEIANQSGPQLGAGGPQSPAAASSTLFRRTSLSPKRIGPQVQ